MSGNGAARYGEKITNSPDKSGMTDLKVIAPVWCVAGRSSLVRGTFAAPSVTGTIQSTGSAIGVFGWCCPHQYFSESLFSVSLNSGARSAPAREKFLHINLGEAASHWVKKKIFLYILVTGCFFMSCPDISGHLLTICY